MLVGHDRAALSLVSSLELQIPRGGRGYFENECFPIIGLFASTAMQSFRVSEFSFHFVSSSNVRASRFYAHTTYTHTHTFIEIRACGLACTFVIAEEERRETEVVGVSLKKI